MPVRRGHDLRLDVPRIVEVRLGEHSRVAEAELCLGGTLAIRLVNLVSAANHPHTAATATGQHLDHDAAWMSREEAADFLNAARLLGRVQHRNPGRVCGTTRRLLPNSSSSSASGPTKIQPAAARARAKSAFSPRNS
jgi:hypothetical protein